jgi:4-amino-4-deoxy-L-arabinose transferase-like glycosyltransferase
MEVKNSTYTVAAFAALLFIPFLGNVHLFDWDEINFAESAREMLVTHEFFRVQINYQPFWEKPPLFFWLQAASMSIFGINEFAARFPNAICGILTLCLLFHIGKKKFGIRMAWLWVLFMTGSFTPSLYFKSGIIDPWFNLFIFYAIWQLSIASQRHEAESRNKRFALIGLSLGLAVLTKGPVALLVSGLCGAAFMIRSRFYIYFNVKQLAIMLGCILSISSLWVIVEISKNGLQVLADFLAYQVDLFRNPVAGHGQPWFYHPVVLLIGCFPASIFGIRGFFTKTQSVEENIFRQWMSIMFWVVLILFSLVTTKIVHYSSLCYIPLTFMAAFAVDKSILHQQKLRWWLIVPFALLGIIICTLLSALPLIELFKHQITPYIKDDFAVASFTEIAPWMGFEFVLGVIMLGVIIYAAVIFNRSQTSKAIQFLLVCFSIAIPAYISWVVPKIEVYTQRPAIEFYEGLQGQDCYVESLGHKSYAQYFYSRSQPQQNPEYHNIQWLLEGKIDKPVYFVLKVNHLKDYEQYHLTEVKRKGGFVLLMRNRQL